MSYTKENPNKMNILEFEPRVEVLSKLNENVFKFTLSGINFSFANALRRIILSEVPIVVFRVSPNDKNKCNIITNTCGMHNEIVKHRLSCIPIHIKDVNEFPIKNYIMELNVKNNTDTTMYVTTKDFIIKDIVSGKQISQEKIQEIFPANDITGDYIDFVRLNPKPAETIQSKCIHLTCEFDIGTAKEDGAYNVVSTCSYGNTIDIVEQEKQLQQLKQKWKDEGKDVDFEEKNWKLLEGKRIYIKNSFDFIIETIGIYTNHELLVIACKIMIEKLENFVSIIEKNEIEINVSDNTMSNCYDIILENEDHTLGNVIEYLFLKKYYETKVLTYCGFKMLHPHDNYGIIRVAYKDVVDKSYVIGNLKECVTQAIDIFDKIKKVFIKLFPK